MTLLPAAAIAFALLSDAAICAAPVQVGADDAAVAASAYTLEVPTAPVRVKKGASATARVSIIPKSDAHVDPKSPVTLTLSSGAAIELTKAKLNKTDAKYDKEGMQLDVPFTGKVAGADTVKASLIFYICTANLCEKQKRDIVIPVVVD